MDSECFLYGNGLISQLAREERFIQDGRVLANNKKKHANARLPTVTTIGNTCKLEGKI